MSPPKSRNKVRFSESLLSDALHACSPPYHTVSRPFMSARSSLEPVTASLPSYETPALNAPSRSFDGVPNFPALNGTSHVDRAFHAGSSVSSPASVTYTIDVSVPVTRHRGIAADATSSLTSPVPAASRSRTYTREAPETPSGLVQNATLLPSGDMSGW